jgi:hypothetical protein
MCCSIDNFVGVLPLASAKMLSIQKLQHHSFTGLPGRPNRLVANVSRSTYDTIPINNIHVTLKKDGNGFEGRSY